jgi:hypothetical protein
VDLTAPDCFPSSADVEDFYAQCDPGESRFGFAPIVIPSFSPAKFGVIDWVGVDLGGG